ncbi:hypothetical protein COCVIDRAFT_112674, partial [Bipolaris victoriae FI3]
PPPPSALPIHSLSPAASCKHVCRWAPPTPPAHRSAALSLPTTLLLHTKYLLS